jgi:hypothetical protein
MQGYSSRLFLYRPQKMASTNVSMADSDSDVLSDALDTEVLDARSMIPDEYRNPPPAAESSQSLVWIGGKQYIEVDHAANVRLGTPGSHHTQKADEFNDYIGKDPTPISDVKSFNPIAWWDGSQGDYPTLFQYALDTLAIPATAAECERTFSSAKKLISPERNRLADEVIEASECLKAWFDNDMIRQQY